MSVAVALGAGAGGIAIAAAPSRHDAALPAACAEAAPAAWPVSPLQRKAAIEHMQRQRAACIDDAPFLALLGALLLEDGDLAQALVWLERSLMLDPGSLGARADHALALAELGQPEALHELHTTLAARTDLPEALRDKLYPAERRSAYALPSTRLGGPLPRRWAVLGELTLMMGYENNLDRIPRLTELTLTIPDGPLVLPVTSEPRAGAASLGLATAQAAYVPAPGTVLRTGMSLLQRAAPAHHDTDWHQVQWANQAQVQFDAWRGLAELGVTWVGGPLTESYRLVRWGLAGDIAVDDCRARVALEGERRTMSVTATLDAQITAGLVKWQCPLPALPGWDWSLAYRLGGDRPESEFRTGGRQALRSADLRLAGRVSQRTRVDAGLRITTLRDSSGYSPLLDDNALRQLRLRQFSLEVAWALDDLGLAQTEALLQWQSSRQRSNLEIFAYRANSVYGGLRWSW